jgi:tetratricopeptide (TPR) repeat protein
VLFLLVIQLSLPVAGQLGFPLEIKKSEEYEDRVLRSERSDQGKFRLPKRFIQNTVTHYNYFFNANNKLNEVLERAKSSFTDDYAKLLPFYNYTLDATAKDSIQLDSIVYKASTGIALHDLRNDWIDNLYLLWGASYYLQKKFDSAYLMFQFINYAFAPKEKDGYYLTIGSSMDGNSAYSISTKEKKSLPRKILSEPPSRNEAFIWQIRNFLVQDQLAEAASLIVTLNNDPNFPKRLDPDLHEVQAFWFYKQNMWDSAAVHLVQALDNATNLQEKARWEYLAAQLFEMTGNNKEANKYYTKVSSHTTDLILDIYSRLAAVRVNRKQGDNSIEKNVAELMRMAKRDKYEDYRDIIYYMAAQMELEGNNIEEAMKLLKKSTEYTSNNQAQRNKAFLQLANLSYDRGNYRKAHDFYDSLRMEDPTLTDTEKILARKKVLNDVVTQLNISERNDSLQRIAAMPEEERKDFIKKLVKEIRKQQGLKDEPITGIGPAFTIPTLFPSVQPKGEWYFYNASFREKGQNDFKAKWGNRPNVDNWRRTPGGSFNNPSNNNTTNPSNSTTATSTGLTYEDMVANLPLTPEQMQKSNDSLQAAWFALGKLYVQDIEHCNTGTEMLEKLRTRFPQFEKMDEVLFNLYYCYNKSGDAAKANEIKKILNQQYAGSSFATIVTTGQDPVLTKKDEATKAYERIYDLFIEGQFQQAVLMKKGADNTYGKSYWTPQLLYIEAVYYIRQREDTVATRILNTIISDFAKSPLAARARALLDVLSRRAQIETELTNLVVTRNEDQPSNRPVNNQQPPPVINNNPPVTNPNPVVTNPPVTVNNNKPPVDSTKTNPNPTISNGTYRFTASDPHSVAIVLNKIDPVFVNEAKNAFNRFHADNYGSRNFQSQLVELDADNKLLIISPFSDASDAMKYIDLTKPRTPSQILPWLRGGKYSFIIITDYNLTQLKAAKDIGAYRNFLNQQFPGKFTE